MKKLLGILVLGLLLSSNAYADSDYNVQAGTTRVKDFEKYKKALFKYKVWFETASGSYIARWNGHSLEEAIRVGYKNYACSAGCIVTHIGNEKISIARQKEIAAKYLSAEIIKKLFETEEEKRIAKEKKIAEEKKKAEEKRIAEEKDKAEEYERLEAKHRKKCKKAFMNPKGFEIGTPEYKDCIYDTENKKVAKSKDEEEKIAQENKLTEIDPDLIPIASGSGFFVSREGHIITNEHVAGICELLAIKVGGKKKYFNVLTTDKVNDLGLLKGNYKHPKYLEIDILPRFCQS